jgi:hypothetical protein
MTASERPALSGRHQDTLQHIFAHPLSHNVEWRAVVALLREVAAVEEREGGKIEATAGSQTVVLPRPKGGKALGPEELLDVRHFLETMGYSPAAS